MVEGGSHVGEKREKKKKGVRIDMGTAVIGHMGCEQKHNKCATAAAGTTQDSIRPQRSQCTHRQL